ncbi:ATP-binding protein [uncultured Sphingomonas sp.]|uniref:HAMP domain-containing sensor histidine kinase n=1 Tax=uncultured Sphingomonas sp. TaxID=158754 RepID=UPI0035CBF694
MAVIVALALFVAQAINFAMVYGERRQLRFEQATGPVVTRIMDTLENGQRQGGDDDPRRRVSVVSANPIDPRLPRRTDVEDGLRRAFAESRVKVGRIVTGVRPVAPDDPRLRGLPPPRARRLAAAGAELLIAVERPGTGWMVVSAPWQMNDLFLIWRLLAQTLVIYGVLLLPVLWVTRRISRPLAVLASAARRFTPGDIDAEVTEAGPHDVRALIVAFNAMRSRIIATLDEKDRMLGAIGHDLRTPLAALRVRVESVEDDNDRTRMTETIEEMNRTLDDILSLARLGRPSEPLTEVDLSALVDAVVEDFRDLGAPVSYEEAARLPLRIRPSLMRRALRNLIENAIKYGGSAQVSINAGPGEVAITVADRGPGIPADRTEDVFEAFTRLEGSRNKETGGIGLGLALARAIVREARGDIRLRNRPGGGLSAVITLPR